MRALALAKSAGFISSRLKTELPQQAERKQFWEADVSSIYSICHVYVMYMPCCSMCNMMQYASILDLCSMPFESLGLFRNGLAARPSFVNVLRGTGLTRTGSEKSTTASEVDTPSPANTSLHEATGPSLVLCCFLPPSTLSVYTQTCEHL